MTQSANQASIAENRSRILAAMADAAKGVSRDPDTVTLVAISKQQPDRRIAAALAAGQVVYGENRVQEAQARWGERFAAARPDIRLHMVGPLQTNKAQNACALFDVIETLDREKLAKALVQAMDKTNRQPALYVQINTGEEPQKGGVAPAEADDFIKTLRRDYDIEPKGLMCIPPSEAATGQAPGPHFALLAKIAARNGIGQLSMGMSADYATAIRFGATSVRIGSRLFGARPSLDKREAKA